MCGIAGMVGGPPPDDPTLTRMAAAVAHRGPDGQATWHDERCGLAFRRLAIIDLAERSMQPMALGELHLAFNGEIYNYRELRDELRGRGHAFVTEGDAEVLLHAWAEWGEGALDRVNGMFAFAVWDAAARTLTLAVDPFGEKPLLYARDGERLLFASDVRSLLEASPRLATPHHGALAPYLALGAMPHGGDTFFAAVRRLPGAHLLRVGADGREQLVRYWTPRAAETPRDLDTAATTLRELLLDAIRLRLRADVPVGTSLSGGVDSSGVVALSAELAGDHTRHAFTARFPGFERDEWAYAHLTADAAGVVEHHAVEPTAAELLGDLDALVRDQEEPAASASVYAQWRVSKAAREAGVTVMLDGQGADELFAGYRALIGWAVRSQGPAATLRALADPALRGHVVRAIGAERLPDALARRHRERLATPYATADVRVAGAAATRPPSDPALPGRDPLRRELLRQAFATRLPELLRYADRDSMAHAREVRLPFLDRRVAEYALSLPAELLVRPDGETKAVLRRALRGVVPDAVLDRREKVGFEPPQARWLADEAVAAHAREVLLDGGARTAGLVDRCALEADVRAGAWRDHTGLWRALNLELWLRAFKPGAR